MPLVINSLGAGTQIQAYVPTPQAKAILRNQACTSIWQVQAWFKYYSIIQLYVATN